MMKAYLRGLARRSRGYRIIALAAVAAVPDILIALEAVDLSAVLSPGTSAKVSVGLVVLRIVIASVQAKAAAGGAR